MITFEQFEKFMEPISNYRKEYVEAAKALEALTDDSYVAPKLGSKLLDEYISLLSFLTNDRDEDIEYFVSECEYGKRPMKIEFKDGKEFMLDSIKSLYDCLVYVNELDEKATGN